MHLRSFVSLQLIVASCANSVDLIRDYFVYKEVTGVAGFFCGEYQNDYQITRVLNDAGISVSVQQFGSNVNVSRFLDTKYWKIGVFLDLRCWSDEETIKIFNETSANYMFKHLHRWLILGTNMSHTEQLLNDSTFSIITDFVVSIPREDDDYILYDVYNHCKHCGGSLNVTKLGTWTSSSGLNITLWNDTFARRWNFHEAKVKIAGLVAAKPKDQDLIEYLKEENNVLQDNWVKFGLILVSHMADMFNFTLEVFGLDHWEKNDKNGPLIAGLKERIFDLGYCPTILTKERLNYANVILQVWPERTCFMFLTVPSVKLDMKIIFRPFQTNVWYIICLLSVIIIVVLWIILKADKGSDNGATVLIMIAAISQQGLPFTGNQFSTRAAFLQTLIFGLLVYNCYSAAIVSSRLRHGPLNKMNDSLYSLVHSKLKLAASPDIFFNILINSPAADVQYFKKYWETIPEKKRFLPLQEGIKKIMDPEFAFHVNPMDAYPLIERMFVKKMICQLTEVHLLRPSVLALWSSRHNALHEITKIGLIRISTAGIRKREEQRWNSRTPYCDEDKRYVSSVTILEVIPILLLLLVGMSLSIIICLIENIVFRIFQTKPETRQKLEYTNKFHRENAAHTKAPENKSVMKIKIPIAKTQFLNKIVH
ncbi:ionotropic receptor 75a-like [Colletes gigas]|uniref:ionotropic receptor 75a-like n=1 Tax=Colletes gigas TaxID=935657 RepID=UPI001C9AAF65|nr:ionotropic receptor 75a-like [Colletes gigas]